MHWGLLSQALSHPRQHETISAQATVQQWRWTIIEFAQQVLVSFFHPLLSLYCHHNDDVVFRGSSSVTLSHSRPSWFPLHTMSRHSFIILISDGRSHCRWWSASVVVIHMLLTRTRRVAFFRERAVVRSVWKMTLRSDRSFRSERDFQHVFVVRELDVCCLAFCSWSIQTQYHAVKQTKSHLLPRQGNVY